MVLGVLMESIYLRSCLSAALGSGVVEREVTVDRQACRCCRGFSRQSSLHLY